MSVVIVGTDQSSSLRQAAGWLGLGMWRSSHSDERHKDGDTFQIWFVWNHFGVFRLRIEACEVEAVAGPISDV